MNDVISNFAANLKAFWSSIQFQLDFATAAIAVIALWISRRAARSQEQLSLENLRVQRDTDLISWTNKVIDTLVGIEFLLRDWVRQPTQFSARRDGYLADLSAAIDKGRLYFPKFALDTIGPRTIQTPHDPTIPDRLVDIYDLIKDIDLQNPDGISKAKSLLLLKKRAFLAHAQSEVDPLRREKFLKAR